MNSTYEAAVRRAIKRVHVEVRPNLRISRESQEALIAILCLLNDRIIGECVKNHKSKRKTLSASRSESDRNYISRSIESSCERQRFQISCKISGWFNRVLSKTGENNEENQCDVTKRAFSKMCPNFDVNAVSKCWGEHGCQEYGCGHITANVRKTGSKGPPSHRLP
ncbi:hypothetical protein CEXT_234001 [Caerostris extrusa]|uniref:Uncharacterized protein n=1 Tax=Caerostris extrusa TaxID=172846 RepID=A0AAV4X063_CAEEX|nr:hypothetical protein CEXT_234001 [Caerostris extrusa]